MNQCKRCGADMILMGPLRFAGSTDASDDLHMRACRCVACGNYEDIRILRNRANVKLQSKNQGVA
jgi:hypothetical protein